MKIKFILFILIFGFSSHVLQSQIISEELNDLKFKHLSLTEGLSQSSVLSILQDKNGFIWFGTRDGLNRYDGCDFKIYRHKSDDSTSLSNSYIKILYEDPQGNLWIGTQNGLNRYVEERDCFERSIHKENEDRNSNNTIWGIVSFDKNNLWIGLNSGLHKFNIESEQLIHPIKVNNGLGINSPVRTMLKDSKNNLWVKTTNSINVYNTETHYFKKYLKFANSLDQQALNNVSSVYEDREHNIWIGYKNGLALLNKKSDSFEAFNLANDKNISITVDVRSIQEDHLGNLWIGTYNGIYIINPSRTNIKHFKHDESNQNSLSQNSVYKIFEDSKGDIWIGTYAGGINHFDRSYDSFKLLSSGPNNPLNYKVVSSIVEDESSNLWIGTEGGGLNFYNNKTGESQFFTHDDSNAKSISSNNVKSIIKDSDGHLWIGTHEGGLNFVNSTDFPLKFDKFSYALQDSSSISNDRVISLYEDLNNKIWIGTENGVNIIDKKTKNIQRLKHISDHTGVITYTIISSANKDEIYLGGNRGLAKINIFTKEVAPVKYAFNANNEFKKTSTLCVFEDESQNLWIGTEGDGLYYYEKESGKSTKYGTSNGLLSEVVYSILPDENGNIWLSTNYGLSKLNRRTFQIKNYDVSDGIQGNEFNYGARLKSQNGDLLFGGTNGLTIFNPNNIVENAFVPPVLITEIKTNNQPYLDHSREQITLDHDDNVFEFNFIALSYSKANKNQYAYKLEGFDQDWNYVGNRRSTTYTNIDAGTYTFKVKASNSDGLWNEKGTEIKVIILPAPWKTWWAYLLYAIALIGLLLIIRKYSLIRIKERHELNRERQEKERIEEVNALKLQLFTNISHDFRTPLTLIVGPLQKMINDGNGTPYIKEQHAIMHRNAMVLLQLVNQLLDFRKSESGQLKLQATKNNIVTFVEDISVSFEAFAQEKQINYSFQSSNDNIPVWFDKIKLKKIVYNLLSNAFKFTNEGGDISINISEVKKIQDSRELDFVKLEVKDTGKGISKENVKFIFERFYQLGQGQNSLLSTGIGLSVTKSLVDLHNGIIEVNSNESKGSCFTVFFPLATQTSQFDEQDVADTPSTQHAIDFVAPKYLIERNHVNGDSNEAEEGIVKDQSTLLIVEDNTAVRSFVQSIFKNKYNILEAENGEAALALLKGKKVDVIISDVMMPVMDGIEFCKALKTNIHTSHIPILLLTSQISNESKDSGYYTGADAYMAKPFDPNMLIIRIKNLVQSRKSLIDKFRKDLIIEPKEIAASSSDELFLKKAFKIVEENLSNPEFSVVSFTTELHMSKSVLYRKIKALTGQSTSEFIRTIKLKKAAQLIATQTDKNISAIAHEIGFNDLKYFRKSFKGMFNESPSQYRKNNSMTYQEK